MIGKRTLTNTHCMLLSITLSFGTRMSVWIFNLVVVLIWQFTWEVENCQNYSSTHRIWHTAAYSSEKKGH